MQEILLDCRELEAPEPMELVMRHLQSMHEDEYIKMVHRFVPTIFLDMLDSELFSYQVTQVGSDYEIIIKKRAH
jgi:TusA-related sulfurtransferase